MRMNVFEIGAILFICRYQIFFTFVISFECDTLITKSYSCPNQIICRNNLVACIEKLKCLQCVRYQQLDFGRTTCQFIYLQRVVGKAILNSCNYSVNIWHVMQNYVSIKPQMVIIN